MNIVSNLKRIVLVTALGAGLAAAVPASAADGTITKSNLSGKWQMSIAGFTGCGQNSMVFTVTLDETASGSGTLVGHGQCGDGTQTDLPFSVSQLAKNGSGTAGLSCGEGCGWTFKIQVAPDRSTFTLVDVTDPGNFLNGMAVRQ